MAKASTSLRCLAKAVGLDVAAFVQRACQGLCMSASGLDVLCGFVEESCSRCDACGNSLSCTQCVAVLDLPRPNLGAGLAHSLTDLYLQRCGPSTDARVCRSDRCLGAEQAVVVQRRLLRLPEVLLV